MRKTICTTMAFLVLAALLTGCAASAKLAEGFDKDAVTDRAKEVVEVINTLDYEAVVALLREDLQSQVTAEKLKEGWDGKLSTLGAFTDYSNITVVGQKSGETDYAVAVVAAKYEKGSAIYTLSFDIDMELAGLYMK